MLYVGEYGTLMEAVQEPVSYTHLDVYKRQGMYYELTYNGDKKELYFDAYKKWENICYPM